MKRRFFARSFVFREIFVCCRLVLTVEKKRAGCLTTACLCVNLKFNTMKKHGANVKAVFVFAK